MRSDCLLRTGELLQWRTERRTGNYHTVSKADAALTHLLARFIQTKHPRIQSRTSASSFSDAFDNSLNKLSFNNLLLKRCCRPFPCPQRSECVIADIAAHSIASKAEAK